MVCDAPARCFVKGVKLVSGYNGCDRCAQHGEWDGRVVYLNTDSEKRSDQSFGKKVAGADYHLDNSPFLKLPIDMIYGFPCDYMHCVCLGVMRRLLLCWLEGPRINKISPGQAAQLSQNLINLQKAVPIELARKPRSVSEVKYWNFQTFDFRSSSSAANYAFEEASLRQCFHF